MRRLADQAMKPVYDRFNVRIRNWIVDGKNGATSDKDLDASKLYDEIMRSIKRASLTNYFKLVHVGNAQVVTSSEKSDKEVEFDDRIILCNFGYCGLREAEITANKQRVVRSSVENNVVYFFKGPLNVGENSQYYGKEGYWGARETWQSVYSVTLGVVPEKVCCPKFEGFRGFLFFDKSENENQLLLNHGSEIIKQVTQSKKI